MSTALPEHVCYVHCNFCNTILAVSVPGNGLFGIVTVRCGHCTNLLAVNMGAMLQTIPLQEPQKLQNHKIGSQGSTTDCGSSSTCSRLPTMNTINEDNHHQMLPVRPPPEKRQRVPSAYNRFIKEEIQRIKANNPDISHREAFSTAAKNITFEGCGLKKIRATLSHNGQITCLLHHRVTLLMKCFLSFRLGWAHFPHIHFGLTLEDNSKQAKLHDPIAAQGSQGTQTYYP